MPKLLNSRSDFFLSRLERYECETSATELNGHKLLGNQTLRSGRSKTQNGLTAVLAVVADRQYEHLPLLNTSFDQLDSSAA